MKQLPYFGNLVTVYLVILLCINILARIDLLGPHQKFTLIAWFFLSCLTTLAHYLNSKALYPEVKGQFTAYFAGGFVIHFVLSVLFVVVYKLTVNPPELSYVIPFFVLFAIFKVIEITFLLKVARHVQKSKKEIEVK